MSIKDRRKALGLGRKQLSAYAYVDPSIAQLIELGQCSDTDAIHRLEHTLTALENGQEVRNWKPEVDARIEEEGHHRLMATNDDSTT